MLNNQLLRHEDAIIRVLDIKDHSYFVIDCKNRTMPRWEDATAFTDYVPYNDKLGLLPEINDLDPQSRKIAYERYTLIAGVLPFVTDKRQRCVSVSRIAEYHNISKQTIYNYLWLYLVHQNITALAPKAVFAEKQLSPEEKNFRWALNKYFYTQNGNTLNTAYMLMLKEKYCDANGTLIQSYPSFYQFRYYYRKHKKMQNYYISRDGLKNYQRNNRPLLGDGIQAFAPNIGVGMLDATVCDIYLVNEAGGLVGRPILTACVDAYSGLCCGYSLSWEGGVYSLRNLMVNVITDKVDHCKKHGIIINRNDWNCAALPSTLVTDMGKEYVSNTFEQIADLGVTVVNLPPYRPELKGAVEKFFDVIQGLYKPHLKHRGVIETDYRERGAHDYRKDACLTMNDFEKIVLRCIIYYNSQRVNDTFPYTEEMLSEGLEPYASQIWNYGLTHRGAGIIPVSYNTLVLTLLPRCIGKFSRKGLLVNKLRYKNEAFTERYLTGGSAVVAYNPDDVSSVWLIENGVFSAFTLIESRFDGKGVEDVASIKEAQKAAVKAATAVNLQAKINLAKHIDVVAETASTQGKAQVKDIRSNRKREQRESHINYVKAGADNE